MLTNGPCVDTEANIVFRKETIVTSLPCAAVKETAHTGSVTVPVPAVNDARAVQETATKPHLSCLLSLLGS